MADTDVHVYKQSRGKEQFEPGATAYQKCESVIEQVDRGRGSDLNLVCW